jgi:predicted nuclease with TOPRIM domain
MLDTYRLTMGSSCSEEERLMTELEAAKAGHQRAQEEIDSLNKRIQALDQALLKIGQERGSLLRRLRVLEDPEYAVAAIIASDVNHPVLDDDAEAEYLRRVIRFLGNLGMETATYRDSVVDQ